MSLYLCVDCGGSKTSAAISDGTGRIVGRALGGPSNFAYLGLDAFISAVRAAVSNALKTCTSPPSTDEVPLPTSLFAAAWFGVSGVDSPAAVASITPVLSALLGIPAGPRLVIANDTHLLAAPVRLYPDVSHAVTCIAGTGSICVTFKEVDGKLEELGRTGGWGWILGDEGGGFHVGRETVRHLLMAHDEAHSTGSTSTTAIAQSKTLVKRVLGAFGVTEILDLLPVVYLPDPSPISTYAPDAPQHVFMPREKRLSSLAPIVFDSAFEDHDPVALSILQSCSGMLASQIALLLQTGYEAPSSRCVKAQESVICFGGSLVGVESYRKMILVHLAQMGHIFRHIEFVDDPAVAGATGLASAHTTAA